MSPFMEKTLLLLGIICCIQVTTALMCYDCNSEYDPRCGDPFEPYSIGEVNCSQQKPAQQNVPSLCRKTVQKVYGKTRIVRGCGHIHDDRVDAECTKRSGTHDVQAIYCSCTKDLCNHAASALLSNNNNLIPYTLAALFTLLITCGNFNSINRMNFIQNS